MYCQVPSLCLGSHVSVYCQCTVRVPSFLSEDVTFSLYFTATSLLMYCQVPSLCLGSHVSVCCQMSPRVLSEYLQAAWGSCICLLCQRFLISSAKSFVGSCWFWTELYRSCTWVGEQQSPGCESQVLPMYCQSTSFCLGKSLPSICLGSHFILLCQVSLGLFFFCFFQWVTPVC